MYHYRAHVTRVVDGDTIDAMVDLGFEVLVKTRFWLNGIDTPEIYRPSNDAELQHGQEAKKFLEEMILGKEVLICSTKIPKKGKYGRWGADICLMDGTDVIQELRDAGFQKKESYNVES